jgi:hypothetical protein
VSTWDYLIVTASNERQADRTSFAEMAARADQAAFHRRRKENLKR